MAVQHYEGGCQCGAVRYAVEADLDQTAVCNCSRCNRLGVIWSFVPPEKFTLKSGAGATREYLFNSGRIHHLFCATCGIESYADGTTPDGRHMMAINARCLDGVDVAALKPAFVDGASR